MTLTFSMKLLESNSTIATNMLRALLPDLNKYFNKAVQGIQKNIPQILIRHIKAQPEYDSLINGKLKGEFGLADASSKLSSILSAIESGSVVQVKPLSISNGKIKGSVTFQMIKKDFSDLLSIGDGSFSTEKGSQLHWLKWLLTEGDSIIITDHTFVLGPHPGSRTGLGIMREFGGSSWRVPPEYAGTISNNWITRAIDSASQEIDKTLESLTRI